VTDRSGLVQSRAATQNRVGVVGGQVREPGHVPDQEEVQFERERYISEIKKMERLRSKSNKDRTTVESLSVADQSPNTQTSAGETTSELSNTPVSHGESLTISGAWNLADGDRGQRCRDQDTRYPGQHLY
jgi:hypothetical protein